MSTVVYISATLEDLRDERKAARDALSSQAVAFRESYQANGRPLIESCLKDVEECSVYVGIVGLRYGNCPSNAEGLPSTKSITQIEFEHAQHLGIPCYVFLKSSQAAYLPKDIDTYTGENEAGERVLEFRRVILNGEKVRAAEFQSLSDLKEKLIALAAELRHRTDGARLKKPLRSRQGLSELLDGIEELADGYDKRVHAFLNHYLGSIEEPTPFGGRSADLAQLDSWLNGPFAPHYMLLSAPAGRGKSALVVRWAASLQTRINIRVAFLPVSIRYETALRKVGLAILASRLVKLHGEELPKGTEVTDEYWASLVFDYLSKDAPKGTTILVIIDGIDEAIDWDVRPNIIPLKPGHGIRVLATARATSNRATGTAWLRELDWDRGGFAIARDLQGLDHVGIQDVLRQMGHHVQALHANFDLINELYRLSEGGDPLLIRLYVEAIWSSTKSTPFLSVDQLPGIETIGLEGFFERWWRDQRRLWGDSFPLAERQLQWIFDILAGALGPIDRETLLVMAPSDIGMTSHSFTSKVDLIGRFVIGDGLSQGLSFSHPRLALYFWENLTHAERTSIDKTYVAWGVEILDNLEAGKGRKPPIYALFYLSSHFERAASPLAIMARQLQGPWLQAWDDFEGAYAGFLTDIERVWRRASSLVAKGESLDREFAMLIELKCALLVSSINSLAGNIPAGLGLAMLKQGFWTQPQVLSFAQSNTDPAVRSEFLALIANELEGELKNKAIARALSALSSFPADERRARVIVRLATFCSAEWGGVLYSAATSISNKGLFVEALTSISPLLTNQQLAQAIQDVQKLESESNRAKGIAALCRRPLTQEQCQALLGAVRSLHLEPNLHYALAAIAPQLDSNSKENAQSIVNLILENVVFNLEISLALGEFSSEEQRDQKILDACEKSSGRHASYLTLRLAAGHISEASVEVIWDRANFLGDISWAIDIHAILATRYEKLWGKILRETESSRYASERALKLCRFVPLLPDHWVAAAIRMAPTISDPYWRAPVLAHLACRSWSVDKAFRSVMLELENRERWLEIIRILCTGATGNSLGARFILECREFIPESDLSTFIVREALSFEENSLGITFETLTLIRSPDEHAAAMIALCRRFPSEWSRSLSLSVDKFRGGDLRVFIEAIASEAPPYSLFDLRARTRKIGDEREMRQALISTLSALSPQANASFLMKVLPRLKVVEVEQLVLKMAPKLQGAARDVLCEHLISTAEGKITDLAIAVMVCVMPARWSFRNFYHLAKTDSSIRQSVLSIFCTRALTGGCLSEALKIVAGSLEGEFDAASILIKFSTAADSEAIEAIQARILLMREPDFQWLLFCSIGDRANPEFLTSFVSKASHNASDELKIRAFRLLCSNRPQSSLLRSMLEIAKRSSSPRTRLALFRQIIHVADPSILRHLKGFVDALPDGCWEKVAALAEVQRSFGGIQAEVDNCMTKVQWPFQKALAFASCRDMWVNWLDEVVELSPNISLAMQDRLDVLEYIDLSALLDAKDWGNGRKKDAVLRRALVQISQVHPALAIECIAKLFAAYPTRRRSLMRLLSKSLGVTAVGVDLTSDQFSRRMFDAFDRQSSDQWKALARLSLFAKEWHPGSETRRDLLKLGNFSTRLEVLLAADAERQFHTVVQIFEIASSATQILQKFISQIIRQAPGLEISLTSNETLPLFEIRCSAYEAGAIVGDFSEWHELVKGISGSGRIEAFMQWSNVARVGGSIVGDDFLAQIGNVVSDTCELIP